MIKGKNTQTTQLAVIGGGPGGYAAAFLAADAGLQVTLIDTEEKLGGVCLNRGCIPSKALLHAARVIEEAREAEHFGIRFGKPKIKLPQLTKWKSDIISGLTGGLNTLCQARGITRLTGRASFLDANTLKVFTPPSTETDLKFEAAIIATGSRPILPPFADAESKRVMTSTAALALEDIPKKLLVIGGGYIGLELGSVYAALGSKVSVVEAGPRLLPGADVDLVSPLVRKLAERFDVIHTNCSIAALEESRRSITANMKHSDGKAEQLIIDKVLVAIGRKPNSSGLELANTRIQIDAKGFIETDLSCRTAEPNIYAIGDVAGEPMLAHKASAEAGVAVSNIVGKTAVYEPYAVPAVVFTDPEIAWCGLTESQAQSEGKSISVARFPWAASGRAATLKRSEGVTKIICDPQTQKILGVGICGVNAGDLIAEAVIAIEMGATAEDLALSIHAHPTLAETLKEAAEAITGQATHLYRPKPAK